MQTNLMTGDEYEAYVLAHGLPPEGDTFMDGVRGFGRSFVNNGLMGTLYEAGTGNPIMQRDLESTDPNYYPTMSGNESSFYPVGGSASNTAANRYGVQDDVLRNDMYLAAARQEADIQAAQQKRADDLIYDMMLGEDLTPQIESGLLNGTPFASSNIVDLSAAKQAEDLAAQQRADRIKADAKATAKKKADKKAADKKAADKKKAAAKKAADKKAAAKKAATKKMEAKKAADKAAYQKRRNDRGPEAGRNSSGNGFGASSSSGSTSSGQTDYGFF